MRAKSKVDWYFVVGDHKCKWRDFPKDNHFYVRLWARRFRFQRQAFSRQTKLQPMQNTRWTHDSGETDTHHQAVFRQFFSRFRFDCHKFWRFAMDISRITHNSQTIISHRFSFVWTIREIVWFHAKFWTKNARKLIFSAFFPFIHLSHHKRHSALAIVLDSDAFIQYLINT